jgi:hypothetical protein
MIRTLEWLNQNSYRNYPFVEDLTVWLDTTAFPKDILLDLRLLDYTNGRTPADLLLLRVEVAALSITFYFGLDDGSTDAMYSIEIPKAAALPYEGRQTYNSTDSVYDLTVVVGAGFSALTVYALGIYQVTDGRIEPTLICFMGQHQVTSVTTVDTGSGGFHQPITGSVYFKEGTGVNIVVNVDGNRVVFSGYPGAGTGYDCSAPEDNPSLLNCSDVIVYVNGVTADGYGNIQLTGGKGITVTPDPDNNEVLVESKLDPDTLQCDTCK